MKSDRRDNPMLSAAARVLELTRQVVLHEPDTDPDDRQPARPAPTPRARRGQGRAQPCGKRERIG